MDNKKKSFPKNKDLENKKNSDKEAVSEKSFKRINEQFRQY